MLHPETKLGVPYRNEPYNGMKTTMWNKENYTIF